MRPGGSFSTGEASKKSVGDDTKIQRGELKNKRLPQKHRNGLVTFKYFKVL